MTAGSTAKVGSSSVMRWVGTLLGLVLSAGLLSTILQDRSARLQAAQHQSAAIAQGVDRLLRYEIRNLERALNGMAAEADGFAADPSHWDLPETIRGVISRNGELQDIDVFGADGRLLHGGVNAPTAASAVLQPSLQTGQLGVGALLKQGRAQPVVQLVVRTPHGNWLVARLRTSELQSMLEDVDVGSDGGTAIMTPAGVVLAHQGASLDYADLPSGLAEQPPRLHAGADGDLLTSLSSNSGYPFVVAAALSRNEAIKPWRNYTAFAVSLLMLYWFGMFYLMRRMAASEAVRHNVHVELQRHADWLGKAQEASRAGVWAMDTGCDQVRASAHAAELFGFPRAEGMLPLKEFFNRMHDADRPRVEQAFAQAWESGSPFRAEYRIMLPDGQQRWISARGAPVHDHDGVLRMTGTIMDITVPRLQQSDLERAESQFRELFERNPLPFWVFDIQSLRFLAVNTAAVRRYGYSHEEFLAMTILQIRLPEQATAVQESVDDQAEPRDSQPIWLHMTRDGRRMHVRVYSSSIRFDGHDARLVLAEDVSDRVAYEADLKWRAAHEESTGLLHVRTLLERVDAAHKGAATSSPYAIIHIQLRDLELMSSTFGRGTRDALIRSIARRLQRIAEGHGHLAYAPADAFVLAVTQGENWNDLVDALGAAFTETIESVTGVHRLEGWIGVAFQQPEELAEQVAGHAVLAAFEARAQNLPTMHYSPRMAEHAADRLATVHRLRSALANAEFELFFQPIKRVRDGNIIVAEALLRWRTEDGYVSPATFIPLCEESGLIVPLGEWVIDAAARARQTLGARGHDGIAIAINVSAVQFMSGTVSSMLRDAHLRYHLPRGALHVELTESAMLQRPEMAEATMEELRRDGVCVSIDDFGTGFSSMSYLRDLPLDHLKIDRSFVQNVHSDPRNASICNALVALGHGLGLSIVAEGVESPAEFEWMATHGVDCVQGYYIARPMPLQAFIEWLEANAA
ncbi:MULTISPECIES: EAL domain-containing protein [unclassified Stenotrophomonas]|uniref:bifunctional diguanylate cyclase/phosphodiesterase n=1 Tax=unclassified Stenotrophomonas TaxID=196198 RepID=UPI0025D3746F|nr:MULTISPECIES: EAL domain-containing protein [unclassified Stenotrophomonas]